MQPSMIRDVSSIPSLFLQFVQERPEANFVYIPSGEQPNIDWNGVTRQEALEQVAGLARRLNDLGVTTDTKVAIWANTRAEWCWIDMAVLSLGAVTVGLYPTLTKDVVLEQLRTADVEMLIVESENQYIQWEEDFDTLEKLNHVLTIDKGEERVQLQSAEVDVDWYRDQVARRTPEELATIVFTSGSTGASKGVMLSHRNFLWNLADTKEVLPFKGTVRSIVCLPLAHSLQRFVVYRAFVEDIEGYFAPSLKELKETLVQTKPTLLIAVPRMLEKIQNAVFQQALQRSSVAEMMVRWAIEVGWTVQRVKAEGQEPSFRIRAQYAMLNRLVLSKIRERLGGSLTTIVSGGAALNDHTARFFWALGIEVVEGWGLSESCAPATLNTDGVRKLGSVGKAMPSVEMKLSEHSEVLLKGAGIFSGYYGMDSSDAFDDDGYFKTGDLGFIDSEDHLTITGRSKDILVTAGGKNIAPRRIESKVDGELIHHCIVVGSEQPYLVALIALDDEFLMNLAAENDWSGDFATLSQLSEVRRMVDERVQTANASLASFEQIKKFTILQEPLTEESGLLTSTQKLKRAVISKRFETIWKGLYT